MKLDWLLEAIANSHVDRNLQRLSFFDDKRIRSQRERKIGLNRLSRHPINHPHIAPIGQVANEQLVTPIGRRREIQRWIAIIPAGIVGFGDCLARVIDNRDVLTEESLT